jgi:hypothetical protein
MSDRWEGAFVAVSVLAGEPLDAIASALGEGGTGHVVDLLRVLGSAPREVRARVLARAASEIAVAIDALGLA